MADKLYEVVNIDFGDLTIKSMEAEPKVSDVLKSEIFCLEDFREFHVTLRNRGGRIVGFKEEKNKNLGTLR